MKCGGAAGAVAGLAGGISGVIFGAIGYQLGLYGTPPDVTIMEWSVYWIIITVIFGAIFGLIYEKMYDCIPKEGIWKGITAGLAIWLIKDIATGVYLGFERAPVSVIAIIWVGFFIWIVYGLIIGILYKKK